jgi:hypothetical protein
MLKLSDKGFKADSIHRPVQNKIFKWKESTKKLKVVEEANENIASDSKLTKKNLSGRSQQWKKWVRGKIQCTRMQKNRNCSFEQQRENRLEKGVRVSKKNMIRTKGLLFVISGSYVERKRKRFFKNLFKKIIPGNF